MLKDANFHFHSLCKSRYAQCLFEKEKSVITTCLLSDHPHLLENLDKFVDSFLVYFDAFTVL